jgi:signal transduction histidine kinase
VLSGQSKIENRKSRIANASLASGMADPAMRRLVLVAVLGIVLPSLVLTLIGVKLTLDLQSQLDRSLEEQYLSAARAKVEAIEAEVAALEDRIKEGAQFLDPEQAVPVLDALRRRSPLARELFLAQMSDGGEGGAKPRWRLLYPPAPDRARPVPETLLWSEPLPPATREGDPGKALAALERHRNRTLSPAARARATQALAALHFRQGRYEDALTEYRRLLKTDDVAVLSPSLALLARYQIGAAEAALGRSADALESFLTLYADLIAERTGVADAGCLAYFKSRARSFIEALLGRPGIPRPVRARYTDLQEEERARAERTRFLAYLDRVVRPRLEFRAPVPGRDPEGFVHLWDEFADERYAIAYAAVRAQDQSSLILGIQLDLDYVRAQVLPQALGSNPFGPRVAFLVTDSQGAPLFAGSDAAATRKPAAREAFPAIFKSWSLALIEHEPAPLHSLARRNVHLFAVVTTAMILAILLGVVITLRGTARELELSRLKSEFVSNVSHELKTPLALIRMFGETLALGRVQDPAKRQEYYGIIARESERLTQLINNVLDFARIESGRKTYELRLDSLADIVRDTLQAYHYELDKEGFAVEADIPDDLPEVLLDRNAISLALLNLLSNAAKYSPDDRRIRVACAARNSLLTVAVTDHGIGIDPADLDKIFEKFYRGRDAAATGARGSGLGLPIARHAAEAHGGSLTVTSEKGKGSTFTLTLPLRRTLRDGTHPGRRR